jgi:hypothetical protein
VTDSEAGGWEEAFKATGWSAPAPVVPAGSPGDDWEEAFASAGWRPTVSGAVGRAVAGAASALSGVAGSAGGPSGVRGARTGVDRYLDLARSKAAQHGLDPSLLAAVWDFESSGNPGAVNKSSGATGLGQVMPRERGFPDRPTQAELLDPETNAEWSARILKSGLQRYGSEDKALAAYLGAIDARGNITGAVDANGTGGNQYIRTVRERQQRYRGASEGSASPAGAGGGWESAFREAGWTPDRPGTPTGAPGARPAASAPAAATPAGPSGGAPAPPSARDVPAALQKQATAASWALSQLGSKAFYNLCQRFIEQAYGTGGQYGSAAAAGKALFKTADPAQADVGDLVFFKPDASNGYAGHAAIYLGNGEMVGATNAGVTKDNLLTNPYWRNLLVGFGDPPGQWQGRGGGGGADAQVARGAQSLTERMTGSAHAIGADTAWEQAFRGAGFRF